MNNTYTQWLNLEFDPFSPNARSRDFYCSGHRQQILDHIVELSLYSNAMVAVTGPLGAGKTTLATNFRHRFAEEAVCVKVAATLFMNQGQFLSALQDALGFKQAIDSDINSGIEQICQYAAELDLEARSIILIIDDAHELSAEVLQLLTQLLDSCVDSSIHALLFGENQLDSLLQRTLTSEALERLAVFPLDGFSSKETHEYIRFKLATAGYTQELPVDGGIVGAIHNSSEGMPGAINRSIVDALNAAVPTINEPDNEPDEFTEMDPIFGGERIGQIDEDEFEGIEVELSSVRDSHDEGDLEQNWITSIQPRYWAVAATLLVLLTGTLMFWDEAPSESVSTPISVPVAVTPVSEGSIEELELVSEPAVEALVQVPAVPEADVDVAESSTTENQDADESISPALVVVKEDIVEEDVIERDKVAPTSVVARDDVTEKADIADVVEPLVESVTKQESPEIVKARPFVEQLLRASPKAFAVQLLASHSETNINKFVEQLAEDHPVGYFETRYRGKPWFVAVLASFDDRAQASSAISSLPAKLRSNEPWIRSVAGIQSDIRELQDSRLVSLQ